MGVVVVAGGARGCDGVGSGGADNGAGDAFGVDADTLRVVIVMTYTPHALSSSSSG